MSTFDVESLDYYHTCKTGICIHCWYVTIACSNDGTPSKRAFMIYKWGDAQKHGIWRYLDDADWESTYSKRQHQWALDIYVWTSNNEYIFFLASTSHCDASIFRFLSPMIHPENSKLWNWPFKRVTGPLNHYPLSYDHALKIPRLAY